jgi:hypothetical protein
MKLKMTAQTIRRRNLTKRDRTTLSLLSKKWRNLKKKRRNTSRKPSKKLNRLL